MPRTIAAIAAGLVVLLAVAGCSMQYQPRTGTGGQSNAAAQAQLSAIPGVESATLVTKHWSDPGEGGFLASSGLNITVTIAVEPDHTIANPSTFAAFVLATAWSAQDTVPKGVIDVRVHGGVSPTFDWTPAVRKAGVEPGAAATAFPAGFSVATDLLGKFYANSWPHKRVATPSGLILDRPIAAAALVPDAIGSPTITGYPVSDPAKKVNACFSVDLQRGVSSDGVKFAGPITEQWISHGTIVKTQMSTAARGADQFCVSTRQHPGPYTLTATANDPSGVFRSVVKTSNTN